MVNTELKIDEKNNLVVITVNPKLYALDVIYSAAYVFLDRCYVLLNGEPETNIIIELKPKNEENVEKLGREFMNELLNYSAYKTRAEKTKNIRETIIKKALLTNELKIE
jgi:His-Xaa-Ser system protein HxsD